MTSNEQVNVRVESAPPAEPEVTVVQQAAPRQVIVIEQTRPETIFVPAYNPSVVYGAWPYPAFPPVYVPPPPGYGWSAAIGGAVATGIAWGVGYGVSNAIWGGCNWWHRDIDINRYNNINVNRRLDINTDRARWAHDTRHRRAVPYRGGEASATPFAARTDSDRAATREDFWYRVRLTRSRIANELGNCSEPGAMIAGLASAIAAQQAPEPGNAHTAQVAGR